MKRQAKKNNSFEKLSSDDNDEKVDAEPTKKPMPESKFSVGERVILSCWNRVFIIEEIKRYGPNIHIRAISGNMEVDLYEERFEKINKNDSN